MSRHRQNFAWQYHNGGDLAVRRRLLGRGARRVRASARRRARELAKLARANALDDWEFNEWLHGRTLEPSGMRGQSWNAAAFLIAGHALAGGRLFRAATPRRSRRETIAEAHA